MDNLNFMAIEKTKLVTDDIFQPLMLFQTSLNKP